MGERYKFTTGHNDLIIWRPLEVNRWWLWPLMATKTALAYPLATWYCVRMTWRPFTTNTYISKFEWLTRDRKWLDYFTTQSHNKRNFGSTLLFVDSSNNVDTAQGPILSHDICELATSHPAELRFYILYGIQFPDLIFMVLPWLEPGRWKRYFSFSDHLGKHCGPKVSERHPTFAKTSRRDTPTSFNCPQLVGYALRILSVWWGGFNLLWRRNW